MTRSSSATRQSNPVNHADSYPVLLFVEAPLHHLHQSRSEKHWKIDLSATVNDYDFAPMTMAPCLPLTLRLQCAVGYDVGVLEKTEPESDPALSPQARRAHPPPLPPLLHHHHHHHHRFFRPPHFPSSRFVASGAASRL
jgi:hypothetical protein